MKGLREKQLELVKGGNHNVVRSYLVKEKVIHLLLNLNMRNYRAQQRERVINGYAYLLILMNNHGFPCLDIFQHLIQP